jgi:glycerate-2-kinase
MALACEAVLGGRRVHGRVIVPDGCGCSLAAVQVQPAGHPLPDERGVIATENLCRVLELNASDPVICLISGGASSLLVAPSPPLTLIDKMAVHRLLLACGADIQQMNTVRKHLSTVKGGGLLRRARARALTTLVISDVVGNDPSVVGSGPTVPDPSTFADAIGILADYKLLDLIPPSSRRLLESGWAGLVPETLKPRDPISRGTETHIIGSNELALAAAATAARQLGYEPFIDPAPLTGDTTSAAQRWARHACQSVAGRRRCAIAGGETTVAVRGDGTGGRNQEFALVLVAPLASLDVTVLSAGTDGIDGPTDAAGAFVDGRTHARALAMGLDPLSALSRNDSYPFFDALGDLLRGGPTGTNVMDLKLAIGVPSSS